MEFCFCDNKRLPRLALDGVKADLAWTVIDVALFRREILNQSKQVSHFNTQENYEGNLHTCPIPLSLKSDSHCPLAGERRRS
jgi:hypothetical protein